MREGRAAAAFAADGKWCVVVDYGLDEGGCHVDTDAGQPAVLLRQKSKVVFLVMKSTQLWLRLKYEDVQVIEK